MSRSAPDAAQGPLVELAAITRAHGLRGEVQLKPFNPESDLLLELERVLLRRADDEAAAPVERRVQHARRHAQAIILKLAGVDGRDAAEQLRGTLVCVPREALPEPGDDEYYFVDLVGIAAQLTDGTPLGEVRDVIEYPSVECLVIERDGVPWEIPILDRYVVEVSLSGGRVVLDNLEELRELQATPKPRRGRR